MLKHVGPTGETEVQFFALMDGNHLIQSVCSEMLIIAL